MLLDVVNVIPRDDYTLLLQFENGERRTFNMQPLLSERPFDRLKSPSIFLAAKIEHGSVSWPGNIDIAPETLYDCSTHIGH